MSRHRVLYDGGCGLCRGSRRALERLDPGGRLEFVDVHDRDEAARSFPKLRWPDLMEELHVVDPDGGVTRGFDAFRTVARLLPVLRPLGPLLHLPGVALAGRRIYWFVARRRRRMHVAGACARHGMRSAARSG